MSVDIFIDMWRGFAAQFRRTFWGALLLWFGMTIATVSLVTGYGLATTTLTRVQDRLPGDLDSLLYVDTGSLVGRPGQGPRWNGFDLPLLDEARQTGMVSGYFFRIPQRSVIVDGVSLSTDFVIYAGRAPLYAGTIQDELDRAALAGETVMNTGLAKALAERGWTGRALGLYPEDERTPIAVVGLPPQFDPGRTLFVPAATAHRTANAFEVGFYLAPGSQADAFTEWLSERIKRDHPYVEVKATTGYDRHNRQLEEARQITMVVLGGALLIAIVAFVNCGNLLSLWLLNRAHGLRLRRLLGAPPSLITLYMIFDLAALTGLATLTGLLIALLVRVLAKETFVGTLMTGAGAFVALSIIVVCTTVVGFVIRYALERHERGLSLGRK